MTGSFFNGDLAITSTDGRRENGMLVLAFAQYASQLEATYANGRLVGQYLRGSRAAYAFRAVRAAEFVAATSEAPSIAGLWTIPIESSKGEKAWAFYRSTDRRRGVGGDFSAWTATLATSPAHIMTVRS